MEAREKQAEARGRGGNNDGGGGTTEKSGSNKTRQREDDESDASRAWDQITRALQSISKMNPEQAMLIQMIGAIVEMMKTLIAKAATKIATKIATPLILRRPERSQKITDLTTNDEETRENARKDSEKPKNYHGRN